MLYSKNGSYPQPQIGEGEGWVKIIDKPDAPPGKEVVWWSPPGWVIRLPKPEEIPGAVWKWEQISGRWVAYTQGEAVEYVDALDPAEQVESVVAEPKPEPPAPPALSTTDISAL